METTYPGHVIKRGHPTKSHVKTLQKGLNDVGCGPLTVDGDFGSKTEAAVKLFQARSTDLDGNPLAMDGQVGQVTWSALFGKASLPEVETEAPSPLLAQTIRIAVENLDVVEKPPGSNRGPQVDEYVRRVGLNPTGKFAWCVAFTYWCFDEAARKLGIANPSVKTAGVMNHWNAAGSNSNHSKGIRRILTSEAQDNPALVKPGHLFIISLGGGLGHSGFVEGQANGKLITIEGNTNKGGGREGVGVFRRNQRTVKSINRGFIDYSAA